MIRALKQCWVTVCLTSLSMVRFRHTANKHKTVQALPSPTFHNNTIMCLALFFRSSLLSEIYSCTESEDHHCILYRIVVNGPQMGTYFFWWYPVMLMPYIFIWCTTMSSLERRHQNELWDEENEPNVKKERNWIVEHWERLFF